MAVNCEERRFPSSNGEDKVRYLTWKDDSVETKGIYLIAHGVCEHIDRFDGVARYLAERGFAVYGEDHLGHGKTAGWDDLKQIGILPKKADKDIIKDMHKMRDIAVMENPGVPEFILGHSMGSFVAKIYSANYGEELKGAVYCGSGDFTNYLRFAKVPFGLLVSIIGRDRQVKVSNNMLSTGWLSRSKENRRDYLADPYITAYYTPGLMETLGFLAADSSGVHWAKKVRKDLPILVISGTQDIVGFCTVGVKMAAKALEKTGHEDVTHKWYKSYRHEILRDDCKEQVYQDVYNWTESKL